MMCRNSTSDGSPREERKVLTLRVFGLGLGALFLLIGIAQGQPVLWWNKAVRICLECIGIG